MGVSSLKTALKTVFQASGNTADSAAQGMAEAIVAEIEDSSGATVTSVNGRTGAVTLAKTDVGLGNVDNTSDLAKPVSTATQTALDGKAAIGHGHADATTGASGFMSASDKTKLNGIEAGANAYTHPATHPPSIIAQDSSNRFVTDAEKATWNAKQNALGFTPENSASKGVAGGYAGLDGSGKVPAAQLPSYVDDVLEYTNLAGFPGTGETGKIYVAQDTGKVYRWGGSSYTEISASPGSTDAVPEGSVNLYHTTARASAAAPVQSVAGRTGAVTLTKSDVGLGNVDNTSDANKPISTATQTALNGKEATITKSTGVLSWNGSAWAWLTDVASYVANLAWSKLTSIPQLISDLATIGRGSGVLKGTGAGAPPSWGAVDWTEVTGKPSTFSPSAHKTSHATGGGDALTPADIGAAPASHGTHIPAGGATGEVLTKSSATDGDVGWASAPSPNASSILTALLTVDGSGSGLDADLVQGTTPGAGGLALLGLAALSSATPLADGTASAGASNIPARQDHRHPTDTTRLAASAYTASDVLSKLLTVDGSGSSLDADTVDGFHLAQQSGMGSTFSSGTQTYTVGSMTVGEFRFCSGSFIKSATATSGTVNINLPAGGTYQFIFILAGTAAKQMGSQASGGFTLHTYTNTAAFSGEFAIWVRRIS